jgi:hypothetical protein
MCQNLFIKWQGKYKIIHGKQLDSMKEHKYLGVEENCNREHKNENKWRLKEECKRRLKLILNTELNAQNNI